MLLVFIHAVWVLILSLLLLGVSNIYLFIQFFGEMTSPSRKRKPEETAVTTPGRVTRSSSSGIEFLVYTRKKMQKKAEVKGKGKEGSAAEGEKAEEEVDSKNIQKAEVEKEEVNPKNVEQGYSAARVEQEKEKDEVNSKNIEAEGNKEEEANSKNLQEEPVAEGEISKV